MEPAFLFALSVATAIVGQFLDYLLSFRPVKAPGSSSPSESLANGASLRAPKWARKPTAPRVSAPRRHAPLQAPINSHEPPSTFGRYVAERVKDALTAFICVGATLSMKNVCKI